MVQAQIDTLGKSRWCTAAADWHSPKHAREHGITSCVLPGIRR